MLWNILEQLYHSNKAMNVLHAYFMYTKGTTAFLFRQDRILTQRSKDF